MCKAQGIVRQALIVTGAKSSPGMDPSFLTMICSQDLWFYINFWGRSLINSIVDKVKIEFLTRILTRKTKLGTLGSIIER